MAQIGKAMSETRLEKLRELAIRGATRGERVAARQAMERLPGVSRRWYTLDSSCAVVQEAIVDERPLERSAPLWYSETFSTREGALADERAWAKVMGREPHLDHYSLVPWLAYEVGGEPCMLRFGDEAESAIKALGPG